MWVALAVLAACAQSPLISEIMANNRCTLEDEDGDQSDWFELHNPAVTDLDLSGWSVSDDARDARKWVFPSGAILPAGQFLVVFASDKDRAIAGNELHTNFKLKDEGEYLGLFAPNGSVVHEYRPAFAAMIEDTSYGLAFDDAGPTSDPAWFAPPTPAAANGLGGPLLRAHSFAPKDPQTGDSVTVTVQPVAPFNRSLASVELRYRVDFEDRVRLDMNDSGTGGDAIPGDGVYTAVIPAGIAAPGHLLRWSLGAADDRGGSARNPSYPDPENSPRFHGTLIHDPSLQTPMELYHWFVEHPHRADRPQGTRASLVFRGEFYDNIFVRSRGGSSSTFPKLSYKFEFNRGYHFLWDDAEGRVEELNLNTTWADKAFLRQFLAFTVYQETGTSASTARMVRLQQNGEFFSVCVFIEQPDADLLRREGLDPDGALYKMFNTFTSAYSQVEKKTRKWEGNADLDVAVQGVKLVGDELERFLFDHMDLPAIVSYLAATVVIFDNDHIAKNYYVYRDSDGDGEWRFLPWDKDLTWGRNYTINGGVLNDEMFADKDPYCHPLFGDRSHPKNDGPWNVLIDACYRNSRVRSMMVRRLRTLLDEVLEPEQVPFEDRVLETRIEQWYTQYAPDIALDQQKWGIPNWGTKNLDFRAALDQLERAYLNVRRYHLFETHGPTGTAVIPESQDHPTLKFGAIESDPASGVADEEFVEIVQPGTDAVDLSGWQINGGIEFTFAPGTALPAQDSVYVSPRVASFRARANSPRGNEGHFVVGPSQGQLGSDEDLRLVDRNGLLVATTGPAEMTVDNFRAGEVARLAVVSLNPGEGAFFLASLAGGGPTDTPFGPMNLSFPLLYLGIVPADDADTAVLRLRLPDQTSGLPIWLQTFLLREQRFTNFFALVVE